MSSGAQPAITARGVFARKLSTSMVEKVWGRDTLPSPFRAADGKRIGEIWFDTPAELEQLLVKYLFTSEKLSVQVHPSSQNAEQGETGKEECWLVLDAKPGAQLAIGFEREFGTDEIARAAQDGTIEQLLTWHEAKAGDVFYLPAGTVHAIGAGLAIVEVQENSDTTFRLYDYGRPRELHLDRAIAVANRGPHRAEHRTTVVDQGATLVDQPHFRLDRIAGVPDDETRAAYTGSLLALPLEGQISGLGEGDASFAAHAGECVFASALSALEFSDDGVTLLVRPN